MMELFTSPIVLFRARLAGRPRWGAAIAPLAALVALTSIVAVVTTRRAQAALAPALAQVGATVNQSAAMDVLAVTSTVIGVTAMFGLTTGALLMLDGLFAQSGRTRRLVELSAGAYLVQVPWAALMAVFAIWLYEAPPVNVPMQPLQPAELRGLVERYAVASASTPLQLTLRLIGVFFGLWVVALQACALRVVSGFTIRGAWAAGIALGTVFVVLPWALQRFT